MFDFLDIKMSMNHKKFILSLIAIIFLFMSELILKSAKEYYKFKEDNIINRKSNAIEFLVYLIGLCSIFIVLKDDIQNYNTFLLLIACFILAIYKFINLWTTEDTVYGKLNIKYLEQPLKICGWFLIAYTLQRGNILPSSYAVVAVSIIIMSGYILDRKHINNTPINSVNVFMLGVSSVLLAMSNTII
jgi:hypothetical protein